MVLLKSVLNRSPRNHFLRQKSSDTPLYLVLPKPDGLLSVECTCTAFLPLSQQIQYRDFPLLPDE